MVFPLKQYNHTLPEGNHPGAFGVTRRHDIHTGVDLYCNPGDDVYAIEKGRVLSVEKFTGEFSGTPWWNNTYAVLVEGDSGIILYGEVEPGNHIKIDKIIKRGMGVGKVKTVLKKDKGLPMTMLHMELYSKVRMPWSKDNLNLPLVDPSGFNFMSAHSPQFLESVVWKLGEEKPERLLDITPLLKRELGIDKPEG